MDKEPVNNSNTTENIKSSTSRRTFMKKAVYAAPKLVALGYAASPTSAMAESSVAGGPGGSTSSAANNSGFTNNNGFGG